MTFNAAQVASPSAGRTVQGSVYRYSTIVYEAWRACLMEKGADLFEPAISRFSRLYHLANLNEAQSFDSKIRLLTFLFCTFITGRLARGNAIQTFPDAERWLLGSDMGPNTVSTPEWPGSDILSFLNRIHYDASVAELFPLIGELFISGPTGGSRCARAEYRNDRRRKRRTGVFYTPADIADFLARGAISRWNELITDVDADTAVLPQCIDPACGTGILLRALLDVMLEKVPDCSPDTRLSVATYSLHGIDLDPIALDVCAFVLLSRCLQWDQEFANCTPFEGWCILRRNLMATDARKIVWRSAVERQSSTESDLDLQLAFPLTAQDKRISEVKIERAFDVFIANPPFSAQWQEQQEPEVRTRAFVPFVELMWLLTRPERACAAIVLPLSFAYARNEDVRFVRQGLLHRHGRCEIAFFDRTPDSLFGDDVKTRATTVFFTRGEGIRASVQTTGLMRWNSRQRRSLFKSIRYVEAPILACPFLPKLGSDAESDAYMRLAPHRGAFGRDYSSALSVQALAGLSSEARECSLLIGGTSYNYLPVVPLGATSISATSFGSTAWTLLLPRVSLCWASLALLSSRLVYWLWRVEADGFHLSQQFVMELPISSLALEDSLSPLGRDLWDVMKTCPIRSANRGRHTVSFSPLPADSLLSAIDCVLLTASGIPESFGEYLARFQRTVVLAGRDIPDRVHHHFSQPLL